VNIKERFVLQDIAKKLIDDEYKLTKADMKAELLDIEDMSGTARAGANIGDIHADIVLVEGSESPDGDGDGFLDFLEEKGFVKRAPDPEWREHVFCSGSNVVWRDTGEVVPGAYVKRSASYAKLSTVKRGKRTLKRADLGEVIEAAMESGLIGGELPLLGGVD